MVGALLLEVQSTVDGRVVRHELVSLLQLMTADDASETGHVVDVAKGAHHQFVGKDRLVAPATPDSVEPVT